MTTFVAAGSWRAAIHGLRARRLDPKRDDSIAIFVPARELRSPHITFEPGDSVLCFEPTREVLADLMRRGVPLREVEQAWLDAVEREGTEPLEPYARGLSADDHNPDRPDDPSGPSHRGDD